MEFIIIIFMHITVMLNERVMGIMSIAMNIILTNMHVCVLQTIQKRALLQYHPAVTFVNLFHEKYLLAVYKCIMVIPACPHCVQAGLNVTLSVLMILSYSVQRHQAISGRDKGSAGSSTAKYIWKQCI